MKHPSYKEALFALQQLRYNFDQIWEKTGRDNISQDFNPVQYLQALDFLLLKTFNSISYNRSAFSGANDSFVPDLQTDTAKDAVISDWQLIADVDAFKSFTHNNKTTIPFEMPKTFPCMVCTLKHGEDVFCISFDKETAFKLLNT